MREAAKLRLDDAIHQKRMHNLLATIDSVRKKANKQTPKKIDKSP